MTMPNAFRLRDTALACNWSEDDARRAPFVFQTVSALESAAHLALPENVRAVLLRDSRLTSDAAALQAFREAADAVAFCNMEAVRALAPEVRDLMGFVENGRLLPLAAIRERLQSALADADEHIDTTPQGGGARSIVSRADLVRIYGEEAVKNMESGQ